MVPSGGGPTRGGQADRQAGQAGNEFAPVGGFSVAAKKANTERIGFLFSFCYPHDVKNGFWEWFLGLKYYVYIYIGWVFLAG